MGMGFRMKDRDESEVPEEARAEDEREATPREEEARGDASRGANEVEPGPEEDELARALRQRDEYLENWQRARADYQNLRRRMLADTEAAVRSSKEVLLGELLTVLDFLDMALATECQGEEARALHKGIELTRGQLWQLLEREGVSVVPEEGPFDPAVHQAVETVPAGDRAPGEIVRTLRRGYRLGDGVLRYAQVAVAADEGETARPEQEASSSAQSEGN